MPISYRDTNSPNEFRFPDPRRRPEVVKLGQTFIACELSRPVEQQTPFTPIIANLLQQVLASEKALLQAERERKTASSELKRLVTKAKDVIMTMWKSVTAKCSAKPYQATRWGFAYKARTGNVLLPQTFDERLRTLHDYITQEQHQPEAERFTIPDLSEVISLYHALEVHDDTRATALRQRENQVEACNALAFELFNYLQAAGIYLLAMEFRFKVSKELQQWGYKIVSKRGETASRGAIVGEASATPKPATQESIPPNGITEAASEDVRDDS